MKDNDDIDKLFFKYNEALKILKDKFIKLYQDNLGEENPIGHIKYRIKSRKSIKNKLKKKNTLNFTAETIEKNINDIAGIRVVCPFLSDIKKIIDYVNNDPDITVLNTKNYIDNPKLSGYSSYHMIVSVPVLVDEAIEQVKAEIQIRTMAMDVIASLEHKIRYKKDTAFPAKAAQKLQDIITFVNSIDIEMDNLVKEKKKYSPTLQSSSKPVYTDRQLNHFLKKYRQALKKVEDTIISIKNEYLINNLINPIEHIKGRIKPSTSIVTKLEGKNKEITLENIDKYVNDVGAIKIVCSFISDAQELISTISAQNTFTILEEQDYINHPKECGYSSHHLVVAVPVAADNNLTLVKIEIQIRTIIMDFWANIEHILCYKKTVNTETKEQLKRIADALRLIELEIDSLAQTVFQQTTPNNQPLKKVKKKSLNLQN